MKNQTHHIMKSTTILRSLAILLLGAMAFELSAQQEIILDPSALIPSDSGYYLGGVWKDENNDGVDEFYNGCTDYYGDSQHFEADTQQDFSYANCMVMPACWPKDAQEDNSLSNIEHGEGYIQLTKSRYYGTDSAKLGYIISPPLRNLETMTLEVSPDVSSNDQRKIMFWIEYSTDLGETWEASYIQEATDSKAGNTKEITGTFSHFEWLDMKAASIEGPVLLRIMSRPETESYQPQRVKVHWVEIVADLETGIRDVVPAGPVRISVYEGAVSAGEELRVYTISGQLAGYGKTVRIDQPGIYIVHTASGYTSKVFVD